MLTDICIDKESVKSIKCNVLDIANVSSKSFRHMQRDIQGVPKRSERFYEAVLRSLGDLK